MAASGSGSAEARDPAGPKAVEELWSELDNAQHLLGVRVRVGEGVSAGDALEYAYNVSAGCAALCFHSQQQHPSSSHAVSASYQSVFMQACFWYSMPR